MVAGWAAYLRQLYGADPGDPRLYHLIIDTTRVPPQVCADAIVAAATAVAPARPDGAPAPAPPAYVRGGRDPASGHKRPACQVSAAPGVTGAGCRSGG